MTINISAQTGKSIFWNLLGQLINQLIKLFVIIVITRLLEPSDLGTFAIVIVFTEFLRPFREWGFQAALIQRKTVDEECKSTAFWAICLSGLVLFLISLAGANYVGMFFNNNTVARIIPVIAIVFLVTPFGAVQWALLNRELKFRMIVIRDSIAELAYCIMVCFLAFKKFGVWALVWGSVFRAFMWSFIFLIVYKWRPLLKFSFIRLREMLKFSLNCMGTGFLTSAINNVDNLLVGKLLGVVNLGYYSLAFNTVAQPQHKVVSQITKVTFPAYSLMQDDEERFRNGYRTVLKMVMIATIPLLAILFIGAKDFVSILYGKKWLEAVIPIQIMCFCGLVQSVVSPSEPVFLAKGRPEIYFRLTLARLAVLIVFLLFGIRYGINGAAAAVLLYSIVIFFPIMYFTNRTLKSNAFDFYPYVFKYICCYFSIIAVSGVAAHLYMINFPRYNPFLCLGLKVIMGLITYVVLLRTVLAEESAIFLKLLRNAFPSPSRGENRFPGSKKYWKDRYTSGGNSGVGSHGKFAKFKSETINRFIVDRGATSVIEFGCGDGEQLMLARYPKYIGIDVSENVINKCKRIFRYDSSKMFYLTSEYVGQVADVGLSLDVVYHLIEDDIFENYMQRLFAASKRYVIIYSSDTEDNHGYEGTHIRHRQFTKWVEHNEPDWKPVKHIPNRYPYKGNYKEGSFAEFFIYERF